ncbi:MAG: acyltransferase [Candidatus Omnitrophica bacterium]|nr:acyltransferase [Candidatus Omnitrophota bacterium]
MTVFRNIVKKIKNKETPFYAAIKRTIMFILNFRVPLFWPLSWLYKGLYYIHIFIRESVITILKIVYFEPMFRSRCSRSGKNLRMEKLPYIVGEGKIEIGNNVYISGRIVVGFNDRFNNTPKFTVGDNVFIGHMSSFAAAKKIEIEDGCYLSSNVMIFDNDGHPINSLRRKAGEPIEEKDVMSVKICTGAWIGTRSIILKGVTIGKNSIVGAGSVVTKDVPPNSIVAGNPANIVKKLTE